MWRVCHMRMEGRSWEYIKQAIPNKNVYDKFKRLQKIMVHVNNEGHRCEHCGHAHDIRITRTKHR